LPLLDVDDSIRRNNLSGNVIIGFDVVGLVFHLLEFEFEEFEFPFDFAMVEFAMVEFAMDCTVDLTFTLDPLASSPRDGWMGGGEDLATEVAFVDGDSRVDRAVVSAVLRTVGVAAAAVVTAAVVAAAVAASVASVAATVVAKALDGWIGRRCFRRRRPGDTAGPEPAIAPSIAAGPVSASPSPNPSPSRISFFFLSSPTISDCG